MNLSQSDLTSLLESLTSSSSKFDSENTYTMSVIPVSKVTICKSLCNMLYAKNNAVSCNQFASSTSRFDIHKMSEKKAKETLKEKTLREDCYFCSSRVVRRSSSDEQKQSYPDFWSSVLSCKKGRKIRSVPLNPVSSNIKRRIYEKDKCTNMSMKNIHVEPQTIDKYGSLIAGDKLIPENKFKNDVVLGDPDHNYSRIRRKLSSTSTSDVQQRNNEISCTGLSQKHQFVNNYFYAMNLQVKNRRHKLEPYECEPGVCVPGQCNPYECEKRIRKRLMKMSSTMTSSGNKSRKSSTNTYSENRPKAVSSETNRIRSISRPQNHEFKKLAALVHQYPTPSRNEKHAVRIGSAFSFNIDFSKDRSGYTSSGISRPREPQHLNSTSSGTARERKQLKTKGTRHNKFRNQDGRSQSGSEIKHKGSMTTQKQKRCFCTLQLRKRGMHQKGIKINTLNAPMQNVITFKTTGQNTKKIKPDTTDIITYDIKNLDPQECEPNVCVPGKCNPYECLKRIQARNKGLNNKGVGTGRKLRNSSESSNQISTVMKHETIGTGSVLKRCFCTAKLHSKKQNDDRKQKQHQTRNINAKTKNRKIKTEQNKDIEPEESGNLTVVEISGDALTECTSVLYDRLKAQDTTLVMVGGTDVECKISQGEAAQDALKKHVYSDRETTREIPKYKCAKTCTYCNLLNNKSKFLDAIKYTEQISQTKIKNTKIKKQPRQRQLEPYECEPGFCVPGQCDPYICAERIKKRPGYANTVSDTEKLHNKGVGTKKKRQSASASSITSYKLKKDKHIGHKQKRTHAKKIRPVKRVESSVRPVVDNVLHQSRQVVRISSSFSFNIEFFKDKSLGDGYDRISTKDTLSTRTEKTQAYRKKYIHPNKLSQNSRVYRNQYSQINIGTRHGSTATGSLLKRCFCTAKLHSKKQNDAGKHKKLQTNKVKETTKNKIMKPGQFKDAKPEVSEKLTVVEISGDALTESTSVLYDRATNQETTLVLVGGTDAECKINQGRAAQDALKKYSDSDKDTSKALLKYKCANTCTHCKLLNNKNIFLDAIKYTEQISQTDNSKRKKLPHRHQLEPYECEPGFCVPGKCNPHICAERIRKRTSYGNTDHPTKKTNSTSINRKAKYSRPSSSQSLGQKYSRGKSQTAKKRPVKHYTQRKSQRPKIQPPVHYTNIESPQRNAVKIGSNFSFSIEFYKDKKSAPHNIVDSRKPSTVTMKKKKTKKQATAVSSYNSPSQVIAGRNRPAQVEVQVKKQHRGTGIRPMLQRCFCTLALKKPARKEKTILAAEKNQLSSVSRGTDSPNYKVIPKFRDGYNQAKPYALKSYECEPGICIPGECNPYECDKLIKRRLHKDAAIKRGRDTSTGRSRGVDQKSQFSRKMDSKMSGAGILMKRCFCTLKLQNAYKQQKPQTTMKDYDVQKTQDTVSRGSVTRPLKRCFCTAKLFQQNAKKNKRYTVGRVDMFKTMTPFTLLPDYCNYPEKVANNSSRASVVENINMIHNNISKQNEKMMSNITISRNFLFVNKKEESPFPNNEMETILPYASKHFNEHESYSLVFPTINNNNIQERVRNISEMTIIENSLPMEQDKVKLTMKFIDSPFTATCLYSKIFSKEDGNPKIRNNTMQEIVIEKKLHKDYLKKSESERKPQKLLDNPRVSQSVKIPKAHASISNTRHKKISTMKYSPLQSGDACWNKKRLSNSPVQNNNHCNEHNKHDIKDKANIKTGKFFYNFVRNLMKNRTTNDFADLKINGVGLKMDILRETLKNNIAAGDTTRYDNTTCLIDKIVPTIKYQTSQPMFKVEKKTIMQNTGLIGIKLTLKGKRPTARVTTFFNKSGNAKNR